MPPRPPRTTAVVTAALLVLVPGGCARGASPATPTTTSAAPADGPLVAPAPVPTVERTCIAGYRSYSSAADLVADADLVVRVTALGPSDDPTDEPPAGTSPEEAQQEDLVRQLQGLPEATIAVRVEQVIAGDAAVGEVHDVAQSTCTAHPLPADAGLQYVLAVESLGSGAPLVQLNDWQAAWQVGSGGTLVPVDPGNDLGIGSVDDLVAVAVAVTG